MAEWIRLRQQWASDWPGFALRRPCWPGWLAWALVLGASLASGAAAAAGATVQLRAGPGTLPAPLAERWRASGLPESALSLVVQELSGPRLVSINPQTPRNPASVMKLVTTWAALFELGPNYVWHTTFLTDPGSSINAYGALSGPLYLRAGGDPLLGIQDLWSLLRELRLRGVKQIGDLVVDRSIFADVSSDPGAFDNAPDRAYNASPDAWMVGFGALRLLFLPDPAARKWIPVLDPAVPGVSVQGQVGWSDRDCPGSPSIGTEPVITQQGMVIRLSGEAAGSCGEFSVYRLALTQPEQASAIFRSLWKDLGGTFTGNVRAGLAPADAVPLVTHESPTLLEVIRTINKYSNNVMARALLLTLGAERGQRPASVASSGVVAAKVLTAQGLPMPDLHIDNGAGLSRDARVSADGLASLLAVAWQSPLMPEYLSSMAIAGVDGTVRRRMRSPSVQGMAHLKTGSLRDVRALAGYVLGASGKRYVVVSLVNDDHAEAVRAFDDALVSWLAEQ